MGGASLISAGRCRDSKTFVWSPGAAVSATMPPSAGQVYASFVRSPHAHARLGAIDGAAAAGLPGVLAILTAADYAAAGGRGIAHMPNPADAHDVKLRAFARAGAQDRRSMRRIRRWRRTACAMSANPSPWRSRRRAAAAQDAAERVVVDYEALPAVTDAVAALMPGAPLIHESVPGNLAVEAEFGDPAAAQAAFAAAALVVSQDVPQPAHRLRADGAARGDRRL